MLPSSLTSSCHLFLGLLLGLVVSKFIPILFWEFYFLPFSVRVQTNVIYVTLIIIIIIIILNNLILVPSPNLICDINKEIQEREKGKSYKHLGTEESTGIQHQQLR